LLALGAVMAPIRLLTPLNPIVRFNPVTTRISLKTQG